MAASRLALGTGVTVSYTERGDASGPCLVLLPGPTDAWRSYRLVLDHVPRAIRAIAVSQRGHGDSDKPAGGYRIEQLADDVVAFLDGLGIDRAVLAGHSGSCPVARRVATTRPERVAGLVLEASPTTLRGHPGLTAFVGSFVSDLSDPIDAGFVRSFVADTSSEKLDPAFVDELVAEVCKVPARVWKELFVDLTRYDDVAELDTIVCPTLLIWGDADGLVTRAMQDELVARTGAELLVYEGVGHTPRWEEPARFAADVAAFVERIAAPPG